MNLVKDCKYFSVCGNGENCTRCPELLYVLKKEHTRLSARIKQFEIKLIREQEKRWVSPLSII